MPVQQSAWELVPGDAVVGTSRFFRGHAATAFTVMGSVAAAGVAGAHNGMPVPSPC